MLDEKMQEALNAQLVAELYSSYLYLSMSAYLDATNLPGFAHWMRAQAQEETSHAMKFYQYVNERGGRVTLGPIEAPPSQWDSPLAVFEAVFRHEQKVTGLINDLAKLAEQQADHAANAFLQWFVAEQVEEESSADEIVQKLKLAAAASDALLSIDHELGQR